LLVTTKLSVMIYHNRLSNVADTHPIPHTTYVSPLTDLNLDFTSWLPTYSYSRFSAMLYFVFGHLSRTLDDDSQTINQINLRRN